MLWKIVIKAKIDDFTSVTNLCASFLMLGVPSNSEERLSGATIKTLAMLEMMRFVRTVSLKNKAINKYLTLNQNTYMPNSSNFSSTVGALKLRTNSPYSVMSRFKRRPPLYKISKL